MAFKNVQLLKSKTLGTGSYGVVCKAKCDQLTCAAKLLYPVLFNTGGHSSKNHRQPSRRFEQECHFLSQINHPNIVQYLGTYHDSETNSPVLLMELMDESLTHYLDSAPEDIPYHIQVNISYDIAQALAFLHTNEIIHRDLSSNNVLLLAGRAKVADFGMSKFDRQLKTLTACPGTPAFMPPEALSTSPTYSEKLDIFSFGVIMIQIMTREYPQPSQQLVTKDVIDPRHPKRKVKTQVAVPEAERREAQVSLVESSHPLLPIAQTCLRDNDRTRPSSEELCGILTCVKESVKYKKSLSSEKEQKKAVTEASIREMTRLSERLEKKETELKEVKEKNTKTSEMLKEAKEEVRMLTNHLRRQQGQKLQEKRTMSSTHENTDIRTLPDRRRHHSEQLPTSNFGRYLSMQNLSTEQERCIELEWKPLHNCPINLYAGTSTVIGEKAFFQNKESGAIVEYNSRTGQWALLPFHQLRQCSLTCFESLLTTVGGHDDQFVTTDKLFCLVDQEWTEILPPMPTKRDAAAVATTSTSLIVAGGRNKYQAPLKVVEVLGLSSKQWQQAAALPFPTCRSSAVIHWGSLLMTAGEGGYNHSGKSVIKCSLEALFVRQRVAWQNIVDLPTQNATLAEVKGHLFAVGGTHPLNESATEERHMGTKVIYRYVPLENTWKYAGHMTVSRYRCLTATLPGNMLVVVGGVSSKQKHSKSAEYAVIRE